jgi:hypothetical protein
MFGHQDDHDDQSPPVDGAAVNDGPALAAPGMNGAPPAPSVTDGPAATVIKPDPPEAPAPPVESAATATPAGGDKPWQHPGTPLASDNDQIADIISPAGGFPKRPTYQYATGLSSNPSLPDNGGNGDEATHELIDIKQHALTELSPLIDKLDLPPEDKFRTLMMMIQASDDESLVKAAYAAAHAIPDEKARAQALLDIINEVNYFTSPHPAADDSEAPEN